MNYAERYARYKQDQKERRAKAGFKFPAGEYKGKFVEWKYMTSRSGNKMIELKFRIKEAPDEEIMEKIRNADKKAYRRFVLSVSHQLDAFVAFLMDCGCDLSKCRDSTDDPDYKDLQRELERVEDKNPIFDLYIKPAKDPKYHDTYFRNMYNVFTGEPVEKEQNLSDTLAPPNTPSAPPPPPVTAPTPPIPPVKKTISGWVVGADGAAQACEDIEQYVAAGYTGAVCLDGKKWLDSKEAGIVVKPVVPEEAKSPVLEVSAEEMSGIDEILNMTEDTDLTPENIDPQL